ALRLSKWQERPAFNRDLVSKEPPVGSSIRTTRPPFYESSCSVKRERTVAAPVNLPFFYPSIGVSLAPVGCFEVALVAPSPNEPKGPGGCRARQYQHGITVAGSFLSFRGSGEPSYCAGPTATANSPEGVFIS